MFPKRLRALRMKNRCTQQNMADTLGVALNTYQKYEQGDRAPAYDMLVKLADLFQVPTDFLLGRDKYLRSLGVFVDAFL